MNKYISILLSSILSGICICLGATAYLIFKGTNVYLATILFGLGLFTIIWFQLYLYTGKVGFLLDNKPKYLIDLVITLIGNVIGAALLSFIISFTRNYDTLHTASYAIVKIKENDTWYSIFVQACMCGIMIYLAVKGHKEASNPIAKTVFAFLPITVFIICGYEHCVANIVYFTYAGYFNFTLFGYLILMILGNAVGAVAFDGLLKAIKYFLNKDKKEEINN